MTTFWEACKVQMIPPISDEQIEVMASQIKPVTLCKLDSGCDRFREILIDGVDRRGIAFTWGPRLGRPVKLYSGGLNHREILTFHTWSYYGFFKPSLAEVYACINQFVPDWSMVRFFWLRTAAMGPDHIVGDYHWCRCMLFGPEEHNVIDETWEADAREMLRQE